MTWEALKLDDKGPKDHVIWTEAVRALKNRLLNTCIVNLGGIMRDAKLGLLFTLNPSTL